MTNDRFHFKLCTWQEYEPQIRSVRETVYIQEQDIPEDLEWDGEDETCTHILVTTPDGNPVATARMMRNGHIGRLAVLKPSRRRNIGSRMLSMLCEEAKNAGLKHVYLDAQTYAIPFYEKQGFQVVGEEFMDAGIPHKHMVKNL
jgi:predicted GNAT family N-acyltransferase